jgi:hypothetical protein
MIDVLGCRVTPAEFTQWQHYFVCDPAPYFLPRGLKLPPTIQVINRESFATIDLELTYRDSYTTYARSSDTEAIAFLTAAQFDALDTITQQALLEAQLDLQRGHVYDWESVLPYIQACLSLARTRSVVRNGQTYLVPDKRLWLALEEETRNQWLIDWMSRDALRCLSTTLTEADWSQLNNAAVWQLAGTFANTSGPNCFATTLAAIAGSGDTANEIANHWLHQPEFFAALDQQGYHVNPSVSANNPGLEDAVLVWFDSDQRAQHACYVMGDGLALNKNSQAWFSPRQLVRVQSIVDLWSDTDYQIQVFQRPVFRTPPPPG